MTRSALKPLQAVPLVAAGGVERFGFSKRAGGAAVRQPLRRAAARDRRRRHAASRRLPARPAAVRRASAPVLCRARRTAARRASSSRRCSTIARASTPGCWLIAGTVAYQLKRYLAFDHPLQRAIRQARRTPDRYRGIEAGRRYRRLLGPELRRAAVRARVCLRATGRDRGRPLRTRAVAPSPMP